MDTCKIHDHCHARIEAQSLPILKMKALLEDAAFGTATPVELTARAFQLLVEEGFIAAGTDSNG